ncbi:acyl-CoA dehydrogenase family protein [Natronosporangium hydrolyticum]|uniref:Acyl-CoA dehydrogenase family protein n=1 Tax=Natronosporangium hydrolyticum TaxID=2811111 RepID=A0A895YQE0_9ACTN|nr:acyl-CoA dehydrogenase family protein [Natronosporangium hydrolyticum]QSB16340.1 acyl-CoA dehydrogenase family protein [Natronosporangium hydrolyticum]
MSKLAKKATPVAALDPVAEARRLADDITAQARDTERQRGISPELTEQLRSAGLFGLLTPKSLGGLECEPSVILETIAELSRADAATGWTVLIGQGGGYLAWLDAEVAAAIVRRVPNPIIVGSMAPLGQAAAGGDGAALRITGRWPYSSGCQAADLVFGAFQTGEQRGAPFRFALFEPGQVEIHDTWRVAGLRGTGSHDLSASDVSVAMERTFDPFGAATEPGPLYRLPYLTYLLTAMAGFPLGVARRVLDEYAAVVQVKRNVERQVLAETPLIQQDLARCESAVRAARAGVLAAMVEVWGEAQEGVPTPVTRALFTGSVQHAMRTAVEVADAALRACGASQLYHHAPLQRCYRDLQAAAQHIAFGLDAQRRVGATLLGQEAPLAFI